MTNNKSNHQGTKKSSSTHRIEVNGRKSLTEENFTKFSRKFDKINSFTLKYLVLKKIMSIEESSTDLPTPNLPETPILEVLKSNLSREDICNVISDITNIIKTFTMT